MSGPRRDNPEKVLAYNSVQPCLRYFTPYSPVGASVIRKRIFPMPNIVHRIGMEHASPDEVYKAGATREGLASWWTEKV